MKKTKPPAVWSYRLPIIYCFSSVEFDYSLSFLMQLETTLQLLLISQPAALAHAKANPFLVQHRADSNPLLCSRANANPAVSQGSADRLGETRRVTVRHLSARSGLLLFALISCSSSDLVFVFFTSGISTFLTSPPGFSHFHSPPFYLTTLLLICFLIHLT